MRIPLLAVLYCMLPMDNTNTVHPDPGPRPSDDLSLPSPTTGERKPDQVHPRRVKKAVGCFAIALGGAVLVVIIAIFSFSWPSNAQAESPSPQPYPGSSPIKTYSFMHMRTGASEYEGTYTLDLSTDALQRYYS